jgi:hypothetical protein
MLSVTDSVSLARALDSPIDPRLKRLLAERCKQLGGDITNQARFIIIQANDTADDLERELGFSVMSNFIDHTPFNHPDFVPCFEYVADLGFSYELVFILDDSGFAHVVVVQKSDGIDSELLALCAAYASEHA